MSFSFTWWSRRAPVAGGGKRSAPPLWSAALQRRFRTAVLVPHGCLRQNTVPGGKGGTAAGHGGGPRDLRSHGAAFRGPGESGAEAPHSKAGRPRTPVVAACLLLLWAATQLAAAEPQDPFTFAPHPRLRYAFPEALAAATPPPAEHWKGLIAQAEALLKNPPPLPTQGGQWIFYYACPTHNCGLTLKDGKHVCPQCGKEYTDQHTLLAYVTLQYHRADDAVLTLARAWYVSRRDEFAAEAYRILDHYAHIYRKLPRHDRWDHFIPVIGGKRFCQSLDEAYAIIILSKAYDLIYDFPKLDPEQRRRIEQDFFQATVDCITLTPHTQDNHTTWFNAGEAAVGAVLGRTDYLNHAVNGPCGLRWQWQHSVTAEGLWYEGTVAYHFYALQAIVETVHAARACGVDLTTDPAFRKMYLAPLRLAYPNGQLPAINDGDYAQLPGYRGAYQFAATLWDDPVIKTFAATGQTPPLPSEVQAEAGLALLRRGQGPTAVTAILDYGQHGGHHGHPDKLNLMLYANGREIFLDPGRLSYSCPEYETWTRQSVAHNLVVINQSTQAPQAGTLLCFASKPDYDVVAGEAAQVHRGVRLRRALVLTDRFLVDLFHVRAEQPVTMDWTLHADAPLTLPAGFAARAQPLATAAGYQHLTQLQEGQLPAGRVTVDWRLSPTAFLRTNLLLDAPAPAFTGTGIGYALTARVPFLLVRRQGATAMFIAVHDLSGDGQGVTDLRRTEAAAQLDLTVVAGGKTWHVQWDTDQTGQQLTVKTE